MRFRHESWSRISSTIKRSTKQFGWFQALAFNEQHLKTIWHVRVWLLILLRISTRAFARLADFAVAGGVGEIMRSAEQCRSR
jgi:hypothetical protein